MEKVFRITVKSKTLKETVFNIKAENTWKALKILMTHREDHISSALGLSEELVFIIKPKK